MPKPSKHMAAPTELRRRAEARLHARQTPAATTRATPRDRPLVHELEVHQIELEMQNEELLAVRNSLETLLAKYTDLYDFAPVGYLTLDPRGGIREANLAGAALLGVARTALVRRRLSGFVAPLERPVIEAFLKRVFTQNTWQECEVRLLVDNQPLVDVRMEAVVFASGEACRVAMMDITALKQADTDRLVLNKLESTGILAGGIAHDFNNLLTVLLLNLELAQRLTPSGGALAGHLADARQISQLARGLTAQLLTFADGGAPIRKAMALTEMIRDSVRPALSGSNVRCEFLLAQDLWTAEVDVGQIGQVIRNIVQNAREAMPRGGVVFVRAENVVLRAQDVPALPAGAYVQVSVTDQGPGIPGAVLPKIFDPYFSTKQRGPQRGMGLGLTICHAVVKKHDGAILAKTEKGVGSTFLVYLPAARKAPGAQVACATLSMPWHGRVLVMDDDDPVRNLVGLTLRGMGHTVELAENGEKAIALFKRAKTLGNPFELVVLDLTVRGGMGGLEAVRVLLEIDPAVVAIAMSGYVHDPVILYPERYGFMAALAKPFNHETLREAITQVMDRLPAHRAVS